LIIPIKGKVSVRNYESKDLGRVVDIYKAAFAEPPWGENWTDAAAIGELENGLSQPNKIILVAENSKSLLGMSWGFDLSLERFPFLADNYTKDTNYIAELAVDPKSRENGIGTLLGKNYLERAIGMDIPKIILRTDERNPAALNLYKNLGFSEINVRDPEYKNRIYLAKLIGRGNGI